MGINGFTRRDFLKVGGFALATSYVLPSQSLVGDIGAREPLGTFPILQTFTNESSAQFKILVPTNKKFIYSAKDQDGKQVTLKQLNRFVQPSWPDQAVDHLITTELKPGVEYRLSVKDESTGKVLDERFFKAIDRFKTSGRIAIISCLCDDFIMPQGAMWSAVEQVAPELIFVIGDNVYLDRGNIDSEKGLWRRHLETRQKLDVYRWKKLIPTISVWDDHDFGVNDGGEEFPLKEASRQMFQVMFGSQNSAGLDSGPSLALEATYFGQRFYLMDGRFFRTKEKRFETHWGEEQEEWLFSKLQTSASPSFVMDGTQLFGSYSGYESFELEHPEQFKRVMTRLSQQAAPVAFVSGDRHFSEIMKIEKNVLGYETLEITSSALHSYAPTSELTANNPRRVTHTIKLNFLIMESQTTTQGLDIKVKAYGKGAKELFNYQSSIAR
ncbi:MAG: hypothetical protein V4736_14830 [Bdellovibrionota bacterium]